MRINSIQNTQSFKGLWGAKTYYSPYKGVVELRRVDKFYPFKDDSDYTVNKEIAKGKKDGVFKKNGEPMMIEESIKIERPLPFTRAEYLSYKEKDGKELINLSREELKIEDYLDFYKSRGLSMHKNEYVD